MPRNQSQRITELRIETKESTFSCLWVSSLEMGSCTANCALPGASTEPNPGLRRPVSDGVATYGDDKDSFVAHIQGPVNPTAVIYRTQKLELPF